ncbi:MAG: hypothetical protein L0I24_11195 [Pseudonocardia sp.]|nr:hypothetical protein [Pseudonocardia sp.]
MAYTITRYTDGTEVRDDFPGQSIVNIVHQHMQQPGHTFEYRDQETAPRAEYVVYCPDGRTITVDIDRIA